MTESMHAIQIDQYGGPEVLQRRQLPIPEPAEGEVVVKIAAAGVGPWDAWIRAGKSVLPQPLPLTPGSDIAGVVVQAGAGVRAFRPGDAVFGVTNRRFTDGYAEYARAQADMVAAKPDGMSFQEAASMPVIAVTAWQMLHDFAALQAGHRVLVLGGAGNVGAYVVQLARMAGAHVAATASVTQAGSVSALGANEIIDRGMSGLESRYGSFDVIVDTVGGKPLEHAYPLVRKGGVVVSAVQKPDAAKLAAQGVRSDFLLVAVRTGLLEKLAALMVRGELRPQLGDILPLGEAGLAHRMLEGLEHKPGKILLIP
jgi:NADPH:quinone reductase-like Zn-dependent oxidoreductase